MLKNITYLLLLWAVAACCLEAAPLKVAACRFETAYLNTGSSDPGFTKLIDGKVGTGSDRLLIWYRPKAPQKLIKLNFKFASPVKLTHVDFHIHRGARSYGWYGITALGTLNGKRLPLGKKSIKHPYATPDKKAKQEVIRMEIPYRTPVTDVEFTIEGSGTYLALSEVVFEGNAMPVKAARVPGNPLEYLAKKATGKFHLRKEGEIFVLENKYGIFAVDPKQNGGIAFAYDKLSKHNCIPGYPSAAFLDRFHSGSAQRDFFLNVKYDCRIIADTPERKQIMVSGKGKGGNFINVLVEKLYTLEKDSAVLRTDYTITNLQENVVDLQSGYWMWSGFRFPTDGVRLIPGIYAVESIDPAIKEFYHRELSGAWFGGGSKECGAAFVFPYELLREVYFWSESPRHGTAECKLGVYPIKAGSSLNFSMYLAPYSHVGLPDKVNRYAAAAFDLQREYKNAPDQITFRSRILTPGNYMLKIYGGIASEDGKVKFRELKKLSVNGKELLAVNFANPFKKGTAVFKAELLSGNERIFFVEKQTVFARSSGVYMLTPDGVRKPDLQTRQNKLNLNFNATNVGLPAFDFARKYAGGTPKVLAVNAKTGGIRDMVEISRRFDMKLTTNYINGIWSLSNHFATLTEKACVNELVGVLRQNFDCMIFAADVWRYFSNSLKSAIMAKVSAGTGLILIAPQQFPDELKKNIVSTYKAPARRVPMLKQKPPKKFKWRNISSAPLLSGIPVDFLPATPVMPYQVKNVKNHIMAGDDPLLSEFTYGKGKVFLCSWQVIPPSDNPSDSAFFLPLNNIAPPR